MAPRTDFTAELGRLCAICPTLPCQQCHGRTAVTLEKATREAFLEIAGTAHTNAHNQCAKRPRPFVHMAAILLVFLLGSAAWMEL